MFSKYNTCRVLIRLIDCFQCGVVVSIKVEEALGPGYCWHAFYLWCCGENKNGTRSLKNTPFIVFWIANDTPVKLCS